MKTEESALWGGTGIHPEREGELEVGVNLPCWEKALESEKEFSLFDGLKLGKDAGASLIRREVAADEAEGVGGSQVAWVLEALWRSTCFITRSGEVRGQKHSKLASDKSNLGSEIIGCLEESQ